VKRRSAPLEVVVAEPLPEETVPPGEGSAAPEAADDLAAAESDGRDEVGTLGLIALLVLLVVAVATVVLAAKIDSWAKQEPPQA
jgi:hypothetical protein